MTYGMGVKFNQNFSGEAKQSFQSYSVGTIRSLNDLREIFSMQLMKIIFRDFN